MTKKGIIKKYQQKLNELFNHWETKDPFKITNVHDRTQALLLIEFIDDSKQLLNK